MRTSGLPLASAVAMAMALASLGSVFFASSIHASNSARGSSFAGIPPSSMGPPMSLMALYYPSLFAAANRFVSLAPMRPILILATVFFAASAQAQDAQDTQDTTPM